MPCLFAEHNTVRHVGQPFVTVQDYAGIRDHGQSYSLAVCWELLQPLQPVPVGR